MLMYFTVVAIVQLMDGASVPTINIVFMVAINLKLTTFIDILYNMPKKLHELIHN